MLLEGRKEVKEVSSHEQSEPAGLIEEQVEKTSILCKERDSIFLSSDDAVEAACLDFRRYDLILSCSVKSLSRKRTMMTGWPGFDDKMGWGSG
jgi:hypothetical protein